MWSRTALRGGQLVIWATGRVGTAMPLVCESMPEMFN